MEYYQLILRRQLTGSDGETDRQQRRRGEGDGGSREGVGGKRQDPPAADVYRSCQVGDGVEVNCLGNCCQNTSRLAMKSACLP